MRLFVPNCKTELILTEDWTFRLYFERRCDKLIEALDIKRRYIDPNAYGGGGWAWRYEEGTRAGYQRGVLRHEMVTLPKGTVLRVNRVYIRQGTTDTYDSLTFNIKTCPLKQPANPKKPVKGRFWAKLADVNTMECEVYLGPDMHDITPEERKSRFDLLFED